MTRQDIERLHELMQSALKHDGPYPLSSGLQSNYYYDGKLRTLDPPAAWLIGNLLVDVIVESGAEAVGGLAVGSIPIADAIGLAAHVRGQYLPTFYVRKDPKAHGTGSQVSQAALSDGRDLLSTCRRVAIVDDVITTGSSIKQAIQAVRELGCEVTVVIALVERHESGGRVLRDEGFPLLRLFYTNEEGQLFIDEEFVRRADEAAGTRVLSR